MRIAFVYDRVNKFGGAERILLALHEIWPDAPLFTSVYNPQTAPWASVFDVRPSFLRYFPFVQAKHEWLTPFTPVAFEAFDFSSFDVVLSITSGDAKGIITKPETLHICYCLTPTRYLWSAYRDYLIQPGMGLLNGPTRVFMQTFFVKLRLWDSIACNRPDVYLAISENVRRRIRTYYKKEAEVIYPPVDIDYFKIKNLPPQRDPASGGKKSKVKTTNKNFRYDYFLIVSRLVPYKKVDYAISAFNKLGWHLKIIGKGVDEERLRKMAGRNIDFIGNDLTDERLGWYYQNCQALIFPGEEDFGLTAVEVQGCGKPVIAYKKGGVRESIIEGKTGELYAKQSEQSLIAALRLFTKKRYLSSDCQRNVSRFAKNHFQRKMSQKVISLWEGHKNKQ